MISSEEFWSRIDVKDKNECWEWQFGKDTYGYGSFGHNYKTFKTHRVAYQIANPSTDIDGMVIRHTCDNPACCNPNHLLIGTQADNMRDRYERGRQGKWGKRTPLTPTQIIEIRNTPGTQRLIAKKYSISQQCVSDIKNFKRHANI